MTMEVTSKVIADAHMAGEAAMDTMEAPVRAHGTSVAKVTPGLAAANGPTLKHGKSIASVKMNRGTQVTVDSRHGTTLDQVRRNQCTHRPKRREIGRTSIPFL